MLGKEKNTTSRGKIQVKMDENGTSVVKSYGNPSRGCEME